MSCIGLACKKASLCTAGRLYLTSDSLAVVQRASGTARYRIWSEHGETGARLQ